MVIGDTGVLEIRTMVGYVFWDVVKIDDVARVLVVSSKLLPSGECDTAGAALLSFFPSEYSWDKFSDSPEETLRVRMAYSVKPIKTAKLAMRAKW